MKKYGIFSKKQAEIAGVILYENLDGKLVWVTMISDFPGAPECEFDDKHDIGEVTNLVKRISKGNTFALPLQREEIE